MKYGFRYATAEEWAAFAGFRARTPTLARRRPLGGAALLVLAPFADQVFDTTASAGRLCRCRVALVQAPENVAGTAILLRGATTSEAGADAVDGTSARGDRDRVAVRRVGDDCCDPASHRRLRPRP